MKSFLSIALTLRNEFSADIQDIEDIQEVFLSVAFLVGILLSMYHCYLNSVGVLVSCIQQEFRRYSGSILVSCFL